MVPADRRSLAHLDSIVQRQHLKVFQYQTGASKQEIAPTVRQATLVLIQAANYVMQTVRWRTRSKLLARAAHLVLVHQRIGQDVSLATAPHTRYMVSNVCSVRLQVWYIKMKALLILAAKLVHLAKARVQIEWAVSNV